MRILFFVDSGFGYGINPFLVEQIISIKKQLKDVFAVGSSKELETGLVDSMKSVQIPVIILNGMESHKNFKLHVNQLAEYICVNNIQIVHIQTNWQLALVAAVRFSLLLKRRFKVVYTIHAFRNNEPIKAFFARFIIGFCLILFTDKVICTCSFLKKKFWFLKYKIKLLPLGISQSYFSEYEECKSDALRLVFPAQFRVGKNQDVIINAFAEYVKEAGDKSSCIYLPGGGESQSKMKILAEKTGVGQQVFFPGQCTKNEIKQFYQKSNIGIIASRSETFGLCIVEPFVLGRCVITNHVGVADDIIIDGVNGYFFKDKDELKKILLKLSSDKEKLKSIGFENFNNRDNFNWNIISKEYCKIVNSI